MGQSYRSVRRFFLLALVAAWCGVVIGCAARPVVDYVELAGPGVTLRPAEAVASKELLPLAAGAGEVRRVEGNGGAVAVRYTIKEVGDHQFEHRYEGLRASYLQINGSGDVVIRREEEFGEDAAVTYDPPLVMLPGELAPGSPVERSAEVLVSSLRDGSAREQGTCEYSVELLGIQDVVTEAGAFEAYVVKIRRHFDLRMADIEVTTFTAYAPGRGWVAEKIKQINKPLGLFGITKYESLRLVR